MSWLTRISIAKRWVTFLIAIAIMGGSIFGTLQLKTELMPDIELPFVAVFGTYPGHSPREVMNDISKPVEDEIEKVDGLKHIESTSTEFGAFVFATFEYGTDMDEAEKDIQRHLESNPDLQPMVQSEKLVVSRISFEMFPLVWVTVASDDDMSSAQVRAVAEDLVDRVSSVEGILQEETPFMKPVEITGGDEDILVIPQADDMNSYGIPVSWLISTLEAKGEYDSLQDLRDTPLLIDPAVKVGDVADVVEPVPTSDTNGKPSVSIVWRKDSEANTVDVANGETFTIDFDDANGFFQLV